MGVPLNHHPCRDFLAFSTKQTIDFGVSGSMTMESLRCARVARRCADCASATRRSGRRLPMAGLEKRGRFAWENAGKFKIRWELMRLQLRDFFWELSAKMT